MMMLWGDALCDGDNVRAVVSEIPFALEKQRRAVLCFVIFWTETSEKIIMLHVLFLSPPATGDGVRVKMKTRIKKF